jgi:hypothetical protein
MDIPKKAIDNLLDDLSADIEKICHTKNSSNAIREAADIVRILEYAERHSSKNPTAGAVSAKIEHITSEIPYAKMTTEELSGAKEYWDYYQKTGIEMFRQMAKQELSHAAALISNVENVGEVKELKLRLIELEKVII